MTDIRNDVRRFLQDDMSCNLTDVEDSTSLLEAGVLDSLGFMRLVAFIEEHFGLVVTDDDMIAENLESIDAVTAFVSRLQQRSA
jgi:acyl carrier protein